MNKNKRFIVGLVLVVIIFIVAYRFNVKKSVAPVEEVKQVDSRLTNNTAKDEEQKSQPVGPEIKFVGPRGNLPEDAPKDYGFWSLAIPVPGVLSRSGQPTLKGFQWLKDNGWKSDINLRVDGDHSPEVSDDMLIPGFKELGFNYLKIQMLDGAAPTDAQADEFLSFVTKPENQPAHVHCRGGIGRAGIMVVIYRYAVQGWPLDKAIEESKAFQGGISDGQKKWIAKWSESHAPGSYALPVN